MILHFCPRADWEAALETGTYRAESLEKQGFIHCSTPQQVHIPATFLARGRTDLLLLVLDEALLPVPVVWEDGDPPDPGGMQFPHLYAPIPVAAVTSVHEWLPEPDGSFEPPTHLEA
ncbi:DUF952 domain-containing protein [Winogradskya consettensis]|uniref:Glutathione S-transferase n=1 Tax=Winogradskya consettensis TaxID=113560 RepID=A0A919SCQ6_9ACTN|nr:DUF952 domain-containing protein [Actinoplanes consettensis]GIM68615.1 glutathione S-transferase [Actinoplanes consettensis]